MAAHNLNLRCALLSDPSTVGPTVPTKTRLESRIREVLNHITFMICFPGRAGAVAIQVYARPTFQLTGQVYPTNRLLCWSLLPVPEHGQATATISCTLPFSRDISPPFLGLLLLVLRLRGCTRDLFRSLRSHGSIRGSSTSQLIFLVSRGRFNYQVCSFYYCGWCSI